jgi:hypothetical protein
LAKESSEYQAGLFNGKGLLAANNNGTPESAVRLRFAPWKNGHSFWAKRPIVGNAALAPRRGDRGFLVVLSRVQVAF